MKVLGIGFDMVEVARIQRIWEKFGDAFLQRVFGEEELSYCLKMRQPELHLAARFAAKEAIVKALGSGIGAVRWRDLVITKESSGAPWIKLSGAALACLEAMGGKVIKVSLSHTQHYAGAQAIVLSS
ncbi:MAG: holo-ACP synthase [Verrucomicrobiae bacterium]|nr:holo-ACP synthase [Verrucomicrobiae bacterium]